MEIAVFGNINLDIMALMEREKKSSEEQRITNYQLMLGGTATNTAVQFTRLQNEVFINGAVGNDIFGRILMEKLKKTGIRTENVEIIEGGKTGFCFATVQEDTGHRFLRTFRGANESFKPNMDNWKDLNHFAGMNALQIEKIEGFIDTSLKNSYTPGGIVSFEQPKKIVELSGNFDVIFFNEKEWENVNKFGKINSNIVVITRGDKGSEIIEGPGHRGYRVVPKDTTGAGDAFCAGFLYLYVKKAPLIDCLAFGNAMGALATKEYGAQGTFGMNEIKVFLETNDQQLLKYLKGAE